MQIDERSPHALHAGPLRHMRHRMLFAEGPCEASFVDSSDHYSSTRVVHLPVLSNSRPYKWLKLFLGLFNAGLQIFFCAVVFMHVRNEIFSGDSYILVILCIVNKSTSSSYLILILIFIFRKKIYKKYQKKFYNRCLIFR
jgi:hypothetical protein